MQYIRRSSAAAAGSGTAGRVREWGTGMECPCPPQKQQPLAMLPRGRAGRALGAHWPVRPPGKWGCVPKAECLRQDGLREETGHRAPPKCTFLATPGCS